MAASLTFAKAPVTQAIISVPIEPLPGLLSAHVGAFWATIEAEAPQVLEFVASPASLERFDEPDPIDLDVDYDEHIAVPRTVFTGPDSPWYFALQDDLVEMSWIKVKDGEYPRFPELLRRFEERLAEWSRFVEGRGIGKVRPLQAGFTYNNRLVQGDAWQTVENLRQLFKLPESREIEGALDVFHYGDHVRVTDDDRGRRRVHVSFFADLSEEPPVATVNIRCRGPIESDQPLGEHITVAHDYALRAFLNFTTPKAQALWELES